MRSRLIVSVMVVVAVAASAVAQPVVAKVKVENASDGKLTGVIIRGAIPLPKDYDKSIAGLALRDGAKILATQAMVFSTYPGSDARHPVGRPEIVHLAAKADLPKGFKTFDVVEVPLPPTLIPPARPGEALGKWLGGEAPVVVEATDVFGNRYRCEPLVRKHLIETRQAGMVLVGKIYQAILTPVGDAPKGKPALKKADSHPKCNTAAKRGTSR